MYVSKVWENICKSFLKCSYLTYGINRRIIPFLLLSSLEFNCILFLGVRWNDPIFILRPHCVSEILIWVIEELIRRIEVYFSFVTERMTDLIFEASMCYLFMLQRNALIVKYSCTTDAPLRFFLFNSICLQKNLFWISL